MSLVNLSMAKVSVVMCVYNGERFIEEQIVSILTQTYPLLGELHIVEPCSETGRLFSPCK